MLAPRPRARLAIAVTAVLLLARPAAAEDALVIPGSGDGLELLAAVSAAFMADHPGNPVVLPPSVGSSGGIAAIADGSAVLARIGRWLLPPERAMGIRAIPVARIPTAFFVHPSVGLAEIAASDLARLFSGEIGDWSEIGGPALPVRLVTRQEADASMIVLRQALPGWDTLTIGGRHREMESKQAAVELVRATRGAIGFGPILEFESRGLVPLAIDGVEPHDPSYPVAIDISLVHAGTMTEEARRFVAFIRSDKARRLMENYGGIPLPEGARGRDALAGEGDS